MTLYASGMGVPVIGLLTIRAGRALGYATSPNDASALLVLLLCFTYTGWAWVNATLIMVQQIRAEDQADTDETARVRTLPESVQRAKRM